MIQSLANFATAYKQSQVQGQISMVVMKMALNNVEETGEQVVELIGSATVGNGVTGTILDIRA